MRFLFHEPRPSVQELQAQFPGATEAECIRFHAAFPKGAAEKLSAYLEWRRRHQLDVPADDGSSSSNGSASKRTLGADAKAWTGAVEKALASSSAKATSAHHRKRGLARRHRDEPPTANNSQVFDCFLPQLVLAPSSLAPLDSPTLTVNDNNKTSSSSDTSSSIRDLQGNSVLLHLPARIDLHATSPDVYATAMALYIASKLDRHGPEKVTLLVDVRPGPAWKNPPAYSMMSFIRSVAQAVHDLHPHRLQYCILYPVPRPAVYIWHLVHAFLDPNVRESVVVLSGPAGIHSAVPVQLKEYLSAPALQALEQARAVALQE